MSNYLNYKNINSVILNNNYPLLIVGDAIKFFPNALVIDSKISNKDYSVVNGINGIELPSWLKKLSISSVKNSKNICKNNEKDYVYLLIQDIDNLNINEQLKFLELLKYRKINGFKVPNNCKIILTCENDCLVNKKLSDLCLIYKVD